jgi:hypothetical protein
MYELDLLVLSGSGTAQKQGGVAESFNAPSENAEGRLSAVIGRRQFALGDEAQRAGKPAPWKGWRESWGPGPAPLAVAVLSWLCQH